MAALVRIDVVGGPSKWDLMLGLFDPNVSNERRMVSFKLGNQERTEMAVFINLVALENSDGENWLIEGFVPGENNPPFRGYYSTQTRTGWIELNGRWVKP